LNLEDIKATGKISIDALHLIKEVDIACKAEDKEFSYKVMEKIQVNNKNEAVVTIILSIRREGIPYLLRTNRNPQKTICSD